MKKDYIYEIFIMKYDPVIWRLRGHIINKNVYIKNFA
jgi:hypothetical protein